MTVGIKIEKPKNVSINDYMCYIHKNNSFHLPMCSIINDEIV